MDCSIPSPPWRLSPACQDAQARPLTPRSFLVDAYGVAWPLTWAVRGIEEEEEEEDWGRGRGGG